jgi:sulfite reductase (ferredoxin)
MKSSNSLWKQRLAAEISPQLADELDAFETEIELRKQGKMDEKIFAETRLRRGAYGQRYDNGQRYDGKQTQQLGYDPARGTKGPNTIWDAPGMQRIKIPYGGMNARQLEVMADLAEEYSDCIGHITTRQDFQLHYVHIEDSVAVMRRLAAVGITTREACGNSVRNVTGCPFAGVCQDEAFDITPYARAMMKFLLGHPDTQNFGRKFKIAFSGCHQHACGLTTLHDMGYTAVTRTVDGKVQRGFKLIVGGGLGAVPYAAKVFDEFQPIEEMLPIAQAVSRVFARHGEKKTRSRARMKFLVENWGIEKFREEVLKERATLTPDPRWTDFLKEIDAQLESPLKPPGVLPDPNGSEVYRQWLSTNLREQRQDGYVAVTVALPLGDITSNQLRALADIVRKYTKDTIRTTVEQNFVIRWVSKADVPALFKELDAVGLGQPGASTIFDVIACPGTDTCKLGISSSRGLAGELRDRLLHKGFQLDEAIRNLHVKISGCFNSCGQHHIADIGFYGVSRNVKGFKVPHFQVVVGGQWEANAGSYGLPIVAIPSKRIPDALDRLTDYYVRTKEKDERFVQFVKRVGKGPIRELLEPLTENLPEHDADRSFYSDWSDPREYTTGDIGKGECAGEVVSAYEFAMTDADRIAFKAQLALEAGDIQKAGKDAYKVMIKSAKALVQIQYDDVTEDDPDEVVDEFKERFFDTGLFLDPFMGPKFANFLFAAHESAGQTFTSDSAKHAVEEATLFVEAVHSCYNRIRTENAAVK